MIKKIVDLKSEKNWGGRKIAKHLGTSRHAVEKILSLLKYKGEDYVMTLDWEKMFPRLNGVAEDTETVEEEEKKVDLKDHIGLDRKVKKQTKELRQLRRKYEHVLKQNEELENTSGILKELEEGLTGINLHPVGETKKSKSGKNQAIAFMIASDWHVEEDVDPDTINGMNEYNMDIAEARSRKFFENGVKIIKNCKTFNDIDTLVLALLGDMITGYIHEELLESNNASPTEAVLFASELIIWGIEYIKANTDLKEIVVPCSFGNHGRTQKQKKVSTSAKNSYEWLMYKNLQRHYKDDPKVEFIVESGYHTYLEVFDKYLIRFHHGDSMRYGGGVGGLTIPVNKAINQWNKIRHAYLDVFGHFHQLRDNGNFIVNGCFSEDMKVTMADGTRKAIKDVQIGEEVLNRTGDINRIVNKLEKPHYGRLMNIRFQGKQNDIRCTPNHEFWAIKSNQLEQTLTPRGSETYIKTDAHVQPQWINAEYLSKGDLIQIPWDKEVIDNDQFDLDFCRLLGFYLSEGSISRRYSKKAKLDKLNQINFTFHIDEVEYFDFVTRTLENRYECHVGSSIRENKTTRAVVVSREHISNEFYALCGKGAFDKKMADVLMKLPKEKQEQILIGWLQGDGHINRGKSDKGRFRNISGATVSYNLACQMYMIALRCGLQPRMYMQEANKQRKSNCYSIHFGKQDFHYLLPKLGVEEGYFEEDMEKFLKTKIGMHHIGGDLFVPIDMIWSETYEGSVYDLQIDNEHSYVINGIGVHNSLIGYAAYALSIKADYEPPRQAFFLIDEKFGKTVVCPIYVDDAVIF